MLHNLQQSLSFLAARGVAVEEVSARDVQEGNLKAILGLFFQLSRYKQQQKQLQMQQQQVRGMVNLCKVFSLFLDLVHNVHIV